MGAREVAAPGVALFVRPPVPGRVKTRLAASIGAELACWLYRAMVADALQAIRASGLPLHLFVAGLEHANLPRSWLRAATRVWPQGTGDIGVRMAAAFAACFAQGMSRMLLAGSDLPDLDARVLTAAAGALSTHEVVLAPAEDGGYGLIGLRRQHVPPALFTDIPWSTDQVLIRTLARCDACNLRVQLLSSLRDIDTRNHLRAYLRRPHAGARATNRLLAASGLANAPQGPTEFRPDR